MKLRWLLFPILLLGFSFVGIKSINTTKEVTATNIGSDTIKTYLFVTGSQSYNSMQIAFTSSSAYSGVDSNPRYEMVKVNDYVFGIKINSSLTQDYLKFYYDGNNGYTRSGRKATTIVHDTTNSSFLSGSFASSIKYLSSESSTRRLWFTFENSISNAFPVLVNSTNKYVMNKIHNHIDDKDYYYVDVPSSISGYGVGLINTAVESMQSVVTSESKTNAEMHKIKVVGISTLSDVDLDNTSFDQYIINEYLKGFSSCLSSDINGYGAISYIQRIYDRYESYNDGSLEDVYQDDYLKSDFVDDEYQTNSIRGGYEISAKDKYDELYSRGNSRNEKILLNSVTTNKVNIIITVSIISTSTLGIYFLIRKRHNAL